ncbi:hypothetical protein QMZ05_05875 [Bradyrhizobium sp. INPA03-11B]|uniref:hypothetical protein n=1 Tax=Bradyrhizobium sp. INPA03-11B TaxID=418598 RepID=UPI00338EC13B
MSGSFPQALHAAYLVACLTLFVPPASADPANAQESRQSPPPTPVPTFESLPHTALPKVRFHGWCGRNDRYLLDENGQLNAYEAGTKVAGVAISPDRSWQCSRDGRQLIYISIPHVFLVDIASGDSRWIASYDERPSEVAFSPDFESVASSSPLELKPQAPQLKVILVKEKKTRGKTERPEWIKWSENGTEIAVVYPTSVEILDRNGATIVSMTKPNTGWVKDGWFEKDQRALTLFMETEQPPGSVLKCSLAGKRCLSRPRIESISIGGRGTVGTVIPLGKPPVREDDSILISEKYAAEIRDTNSRLLVRQVLSTRTGLWSFHIAVSPSGKWSILTWDNEHQPGCVSGEGSASVYKCRQGMLVDLTKVIK